MSENFRTFKLAGGGFADVPESQLKSWMQEMDSNGVDFEDAHVSADMQVGEPEVIKSSAGGQGGGVSPDWGRDQDMGFMDRFSSGLKDAGQWIKETNDDGIRGFNQGATWGGSDELAGVLGGNVGAERAANRAAEQRSPVAFNFDRALGVVPGLVGGPATALGRTALAAGEGFAGGALGSDSNDWGQTIEDGLQGTLTSGLLSGAGELGRGAWQGLKKGGQKLVGLADEVRNQAFGGTADDFKKLARTEGLDYVEGGPGEAARRLGLTNKVIPQSPSDYAHRSKDMMNVVGGEKSAALAEADQALGTHVATDDLANALRGRGQGAAMDATTEGAGEMNRMDEMAGLLQQQRGPMLVPSELDAQKQAYYRRGYQNDKISDSTAGIGAEANRMAGSEARGMLDDALQYAPPGVQGRVQDANQNYGELATINNMSRNRAAGNQAAGNEGFFGTLMRPATQVLKNYGPDAAANAMTLAGQAPAPIAGMAQTSSRMLNAGAPTFGGMAGDRQDPSPGMTGPGAGVPSDQQFSNGVPDGTLGYKTPEVARQMLQENPMAFGPYTQQLQQAMQSPDPSDLVRLLDRLETTDDNWSRTYLKQLHQGTAGQ